MITGAGRRFAEEIGSALDVVLVALALLLVIGHLLLVAEMLDSS
jgi:hypothetical protein